MPGVRQPHPLRAPAERDQGAAPGRDGPGPCGLHLHGVGPLGRRRGHAPGHKAKRPGPPEIRGNSVALQENNATSPEGGLNKSRAFRNWISRNSRYVPLVSCCGRAGTRNWREILWGAASRQRFVARDVAAQKRVLGASNFVWGV